MKRLIPTLVLALAMVLAGTQRAAAQEEMQYITSCNIGDTFKDIAMEDTDARYCKLSDWCGQGRYVLIDFWASWCPPCREEIPFIVAYYERYHRKGFEVVGVSLDKSKEAWVGAINSFGMKWPQMSDLKGWRSAAVSTYGIRAIPSSILVDPNGRVVALNLRGHLLGDKLKEIYGE
ncbi:MAG: TlpA family protein disulfide reductase [Prevotella sp.]|nr:TlpA family protein disulfide reductase [Prevotella sp.]